MSDDIPSYAALSAQYVAMQWLRRHPLSDTRRVALYAALIEHMDTTAVCYPGTRRLSTITRISRPVVLKLLKEFERNGVLEFLDPPTSGSAPRHMRLHFDCLALVNPALTTNEADDKSFVVKPGLTANEPGREPFVVNHALTANEPIAVNPALTSQKPFVVNSESICGQPSVDPNSKQEYAGDSHASGPPASEKSDVRKKADPPSNDAVQKKAVADHQRWNNTKSVRARRT